MKIIKKILLTLILILFSTACSNKNNEVPANPENQAPEPQAENQNIGETCAYKKISGMCQITYLSKTNASIDQINMIGGPGYEGYEIKYKFIPTNPDLLNDETIMEKEHLFLLANSWYPGEQYLKKYKIVKDALFNCELAQISKGTCTPNILSINEINNIDYFETENQ